MSVSKKFNTVGNTQVTVSTTAINLATHLTDNAENVALNECDIWTIQVEDANIRVMFGGDIPTASLGILLTPLQVMTIFRAPDKIYFIRAGGSNAKVNLQAGQAVANFTS